MADWATGKPDDLARLIGQYLSEYSQEITVKTKRAVDIVANEVNAEIKARVPFTQRSGNYVRAFRIKTQHETKYNKTKAWHVVDGEYRLTHLLEHGHALKGGGRARAFPHIIYGEQLAEKRLQELIEGGIEDA